MTWTFCTSGSAKAKAGVNANTTMASAILDEWCDEAEDVVCGVARADLITLSGSLTANGINIIKNVVANMIAQQIIDYDPDAIGRSTAALKQNVKENQIGRGLAILKEDKNKTYLGIT